MNTAVAAQTDYGQLLKEAWALFTKSENLIPLLIGAVVLPLGSFTIILGPPLALGYIRTALKVARGERVAVDDLWSGFKDFGASWILAIVAGVLISIGFMLLVVPGVVLSFLFAWAFHILAVRPEAGVGEALKESIQISKNHVVDVLVLFLIGGVLSAILSFTFVGSFAVAAFTALLSAIMFVRFVRSGGGQF